MPDGTACRHEKDSDATPSAPPSAPPPLASREGSAPVDGRIGGLASFITFWWWAFTDFGTTCDISAWLSEKGWAWITLMAGTIVALAAIAAGIVALRQRGEPGRRTDRVGILLGVLAMTALVLVFSGDHVGALHGGGDGT